MHLDRYRAHVRTLCEVSLRRLPKMLDARTGLFVQRVDGEHLRPSSVSVRYSAFSALGLERAEEAGLDVGLDPGGVYVALDAARPRIESSGDLGLVLWASARRERGLAERALADLLGFGTLTARRDEAAYRSTELAWVVTGLAEALAAGIGPEREVRARLDAATVLLLGNRGRSGLLAFARSERDGPRARLQQKLGFFDAQVYSILALLRRHAVVGDPESRDVASALGRQLLSHQQPLGQWPWHYNASTGELVDVYPVYSVHQDAMAPAALLALERAVGLSTTDAVARGVEWLFGANELGVNLVDTEKQVIWRSIRRRRPLGALIYPLKAASLLGASSSLASSLAAPSLLQIDDEMRPYHAGLCLYAFADLAADSRRAEVPAA
jgi:hypothetical protein